MSNEDYTLLMGTFLDPIKYEPKLTELISSGINVCVGLLDPPEDKSDPFSWSKRANTISAAHQREYREGKLMIMNMPNVQKVEHTD